MTEKKARKTVPPIKDVMIVNELGQIEYFNIGTPEFFDLKPEEILGKTIPELYDSLDADSSTLEVAIHQGKETLGLMQILHTRGGKRVRQTSDTLLIRGGDRIAGAIELTYYYDELEDLVSEQSQRTELPREKEVVTTEDLIGDSPEFAALKTKARKVADLPMPVLIAGETGTGKERLARAIHYSGKRKEGPLIYLNCNSIPEGLLEGILFGTVKGSYTDAVERDGMFRLADGGTLFLDEVDTMPLDVQKKLLKAMEEGRVRPLGSSEEYFFDIRIIASCNSSLDSLIRSPRLRPDFYFRLAVLQFEMPPLRKRGRDVLLIADYYIREYNRSLGRNVQGFDRETEAFLLNYAWPGNVRELVNLIAGLFVSTSADLFTMEDVRKVADEPFSEARENGSEEDYRRFLAGGQTLPVFLRQAEEKEIRRALEECDGDLARCAEVLGLSLQTLRRKVKHYFDSKKP